jgi:preprotein translocase subunit YajC
MWQMLIFTALIFVLFYFILLRPVLQDQKARRSAQRRLTIGDEVVTTGGLIGELVDVVQPADGPTELILEIAPGVRVRALSDAIARRLTTLEPEEPASQPSEEVVEQRA